MKVNLPRYEKRERLCLSLGTSDYLRTVGVTSVLAHCTVIHSVDVQSDRNFMDVGRHCLDHGCHISITALGTASFILYSSTFAWRSSSTQDRI